MQLTRYGHACVRLEIDGAVVVIDPGELSEPEAIAGADAIVYTHAHYDHFSAELLAAARTAHPELVVLGAAGLADTVGDGYQVLAPGATITVKGVELTGNGGVHAEIHPGNSAGDNVGVLIAGRVYHPGDALDQPPGPVEIGLLPVYAPWARLSDFAAYAKDLDAELLVPIHDGFLTDAGRTSVDRNITAVLPGRAFERLPVGASLTR
jgi:L-ascorbate metabolism protein UlaG (beta-lactamase superfamily)